MAIEETELECAERMRRIREDHKAFYDRKKGKRAIVPISSEKDMMYERMMSGSIDPMPSRHIGLEIHGSEFHRMISMIRESLFVSRKMEAPEYRGISPKAIWYDEVSDLSSLDSTIKRSLETKREQFAAMYSGKPDFSHIIVTGDELGGTKKRYSMYEEITPEPAPTPKRPFKHEGSSITKFHRFIRK